MNAEAIPLLLDTDIGSDIDDAIALGYLLRQPRCELLGVTTVTGDVQKRAALAEITVRAAGREDVPIHCGRREVLSFGCGQPNVPQYESVKHLPHRLDRPENTAIPFLRDTIRRRPGEVVLLSIGPFSNLALLFELDPEIPFLLRGLVSMCGRFLSAGTEWNCVVDPVATAMVFGSDRPEHQLVGLDVTMQVTKTKEEAEQLFRGPLLGNVLLQAEGWFRNAQKITFHDPLAAALIFRPELCRFAGGQVRGSLAHGAAGATSFVPGEGPDRVATEVDAEAFFKEYFTTVWGV
jgi:purine nucleosidase